MEVALKLCSLAVTGTLCLLERVLTASDNDYSESNRPSKPSRRRRRLVKFELRAKKGSARRSSPPRQRSAVSRVPGLHTIIEEGNKQEADITRQYQREIAVWPSRQKATRSKA